MNTWTTERVLTELDALDSSSVSDDDVQIATEEYRLLIFPPRWISPTFPAAQVTWSNISRSFDTVFREVAQVVMEHGHSDVHWWVTAMSRPVELESMLLARSGELTDSAQILSKELTTLAHQNLADGEITIKLVCDEETVRASTFVEAHGWGRAALDEAALSDRLDEVKSQLERGSHFQLVALIEGEPAATVSCALDGEVARLYGAVTLPEFRNRGCYHALLAERLRRAHESGAAVAITRARPMTSGPLLVRAGFSLHGEERCYRLSTD
ncbi:MAG: GNAT family N-acetyltransferase [Acidimicrobiales bacterium]